MTASRMLVIAIDFGTTYSGYAFSFRSDFLEKPLRVTTHNFENASSQYPKIPTSVLFTPEKKFHSFGHEAEQKYSELADADREEAKRWYYFQRFKMELYKRKKVLTRDSEILDHTQKKAMTALDVFAAGIGYLKSHVTDVLKKQKCNVKESEITWVLTVPALWSDSARQLMREAAEKAGIPGKQLMLALEPEAASVYCMEYFRHKASKIVTSPGRRFMTVDCGGGTVDISVFEVMKDGRLLQLHRPDGATCGGVEVDEAFKKLIQDIIGFEGLTACDQMDWYSLLRAFEQAKPNITKDSSKIAVKYPSSMKDLLRISLDGCNSDKGATVVKDRLMIDGEVVRGFFTKSIEGISEAVQRVLSSQQVKRVDNIFLVGGFAESTILQEEIFSDLSKKKNLKNTSFPKEQMLAPASPASAVVIGAVLYGHRPEVIKSRIAAYTYGTDVTPLFVEGKHDPSKSFEMNGRKLCRDLFRPFIQVDQEMRVDEPLPHKSYSPNHPDQTVMRFRIYRSSDPKPMYVTDPGCEKIGEFRVPCPPAPNGKERLAKVTMVLSGTELKVIAKDQRTDTEVTATCDFLCKD